MRIPSTYHFISFRRETGGRLEPFPLTHFLAVASCGAVNGPALLNFHCDEEPWGPWWELAKPSLQVMRIRAPLQIHGLSIEHPAHRSDVARLQILEECGGVYLDLDVICLRPFLPLLGNSVVLGEEPGVGLCNAVILAERGSRFLRRWVEAYSTFDPGQWNRHSVQVPAELAREHPEEITVLGAEKFFSPMYWEEELRTFFDGTGSRFCRESYCVHLWSTLSGPHLRRISPRTIWEMDSEFCLLARRFLPREFAYAGNGGG